MKELVIIGVVALCFFLILKKEKPAPKEAEKENPKSNPSRDNAAAIAATYFQADFEPKDPATASHNAVSQVDNLKILFNQ